MSPEDAKKLDHILRERTADPEALLRAIERRRQYEAQGKGREDYHFQVHTIPPDFFDDCAKIQADIDAGVYGRLQSESSGHGAPTDEDLEDLIRSSKAQGRIRRTRLERFMDAGSRWLAQTSRRAILIAITMVFSFAAMSAAISLMIHYYPEKIGAGYFRPPGTPPPGPESTQSALPTPVAPSVQISETPNANLATPKNDAPSNSAKRVPSARPHHQRGPKESETSRAPSAGVAAPYWAPELELK